MTCIRADDGKRVYLHRYAKTAGIAGSMVQEWTENKDNALKFESFYECQCAAKDTIGKDAVTVREMYDPNSNCVEIDSIKEAP